MKQNKLLILSLLASFLLLISASFATAQNTVTFGSASVCPQPAGNKVYIPVTVDNDVDLAALDIIGQVVTVADVQLVVTGVAFDNRMGATEVLDQRYPIGDVGGGVFRFGAVKMNQDVNLGTGSGQIVTLELEFVSDCLLGSAAIDPADAELCGSIKSTAFVDAVGGAIAPDVNSGTVSVVNAVPVFNNCPGDYHIFWGDNIAVNLEADDPDLACGCDALTFFVVQGPGAVSGTGVYTFVATAQNIGCHLVRIKVQDEYGGEAFCEFNVKVDNEPPYFTECPDEVINILWGQTATASVAAFDPDGGPQGLIYSLESWNGPGTPIVDPITGAFSWVTDETNDYLGVFEACIKVTDGAPSTPECVIENSDICCFSINVEPKFRVTIEKVEDQLLAHYTEVTITLDDSYESMEMGGFDFLIAYDGSILTFVSADPGQLLEDCGWEYFTYRFGDLGNCGNACPSGLLRIVAMAETNNGPYHPTCFSSAAGTELAVLNFYVVNNHTYDCQYTPIYWFWMDCNDNVISSKYGDTLFLEDRVYAFYGDGGVITYQEITDHGGFPSMTGTDDICLVGDKEFPLRAIDFKNGGVDIICDSLIDDRGDINVNGLAYEIADAVMFTNYFISGLSAFSDHVEASIAASDVNADGITLSVADLVYLVRVIQGDALPYNKLVPNAETVNVSSQLLDNNMIIRYSSNVDLGAALFVFQIDGTIETPVLGELASNMNVVYEVNGSELRVLVSDIYEADAIAAGDKVELLTIPVTGSMQLVEAEMADFNGNVVTVTERVLPSTFAVGQNYPNPFNPETSIKLDVPVASNYALAIYNVAGQQIRTFSGFANAGVEIVRWDGKDASGNQVASGIYFYKVKIGNFTDTKKMVLMK